MQVSVGKIYKFDFKFDRKKDKAKYREMIFRVLKQNWACARHIACGAKILRNLGKALARQALAKISEIITALSKPNVNLAF